jgi:S-formylglutathione hydrolase FrmB
MGESSTPRILLLERGIAMSLIQMNFESQYLRANHEISIILPDKPRGKTPKEFYGSGAKYKVLWLLHGTYGDHSDWIRKSNIELYACEKDLIVVMPSGLNANYANWPNFSIGYNMYDYFFEELMPLIYGWFPASDKREDNFVAGLSMGGGGTAVYAFNHPEKFGGAAILSSAPRDVQGMVDRGEELNPRTQGNINNAGGLEAYINSVEGTWRLAKENAAKLPPLYVACGTDDVIAYQGFGKFKEYAESLGIKAKFEAIEGYKHEWRFWDLTIQKALTFFGLDERDSGNPF